MAIVLGLEAKLFYGASGSAGTTEASTVKEVSLSLTTGTADVTSRAANGWRVKVATLKEGTLEFSLNYDTADSFCTTVIQNFIAGTPMAFFVTDGNGTGLDADFTLTNCSMEQPLEEAVTISITAEPTMTGDTPRAPQWVGGS